MDVSGVPVACWELRVGAPDLKGSERQVRWARRIRLELVSEASRVLGDVGTSYVDPDEARVAEGQAARLIKAMLSHRSSSWWISHRDDSPLDLADAELRSLYS